ncbi:MAG: DUF3426 domain-containing protein [Burkholderiales bacterium]
MSMNTTCPKCNTGFRVTSEQLAAREGKVRCGRCSHVFNGFMYLATPLEPLTERTLPKRPVATSPTLPAPAPVEAPLVDILPEKPEPFAVAAQEKALPDEFLAQTPADFSSFNIIQTTQPDGAGIDLPDLPDYQASPLAQSPGGPEPYAPSAAPLSEPPFTTVKKPVAPSAKAYAESVDTDEHDPLTDYFRDDDDDAYFDGPTLLDDAANKRIKPHWSWTAGGLLLFLTAALQALYLFRVDVAQALPDARPLMQQACSLINCEVGLPQNLDSLSIESSDLVADPQRPDQIELRATLRNKARYVQAYPNLDFNLTDAQDETLVKRVIAPNIYVKPPASPAAGFGPNSEINIKLNFKAQEVKPAGYRLLLFYP